MFDTCSCRPKEMGIAVPAGLEGEPSGLQRLLEQNVGRCSHIQDNIWNPVPSRRRPSKRHVDERLELDHSMSGSSSGDTSKDGILPSEPVPKRPRRLESGHPFSVALPDGVVLGLTAWGEVKRRARSPVTAHSLPIPLHPRKRARGCWNETAGAGDTSSMESYTAETDYDDPDLCMVSHKRRKTQSSSDQFACHFYKRYPDRFCSCMCGMFLLCLFPPRPSLVSSDCFNVTNLDDGHH